MNHDGHLGGVMLIGTIPLLSAVDGVNPARKIGLREGEGVPRKNGV